MFTGVHPEFLRDAHVLGALDGVPVHDVCDKCDVGWALDDW